jgi:Dolichyl-phosphate-mannose-protein mannosyltransferase
MPVRRVLVVFLFYLFLAIVFTAPISLRPHELAANDGDPLHISWILAWDAHQLIRDPLHLFDSNAFYPYSSSLAFSEHLLGPALLAAPFFYLFGNALLAQNIVLVLTYALSALSMFLLMREILGREDAALVAGLVYAFHTYNFHEIARLQLVSVEWWPIALLYLHRLFTEGKRRDAFLCALFFVLQGLSCTYYLFYFALALALWISAYGLLTPGGMRRVWQLVPPFAAAGLVFFVISLPYREMLHSFGYERTLANGVDLLEYVRPPEGSFFARFVAFDFPSSVVPQFLGFLALGLALVGLVRPKGISSRPIRLFFCMSVVTAGLGAILSLGPTVRVGGIEIGTGPYQWLYQGLSFFRVLRNPERLSILPHFGLAVLAGFGANAVLSAAWMRVLLLVLLPFEHFCGGQPYVQIPTGEKVPPVFRWLRDHDVGPVVELPLYPRERLRLHALYMFYSTYHWNRIVFGRTSFYPPVTGYLAWELRNFPDADSIALLAGLGVERIVVHPNIWTSSERAGKLARLQDFADRLTVEGRFPPVEGPAYDDYGFGDEIALRLTRSGEIPPTSGLCVPSEEIDPADWVLDSSAETPATWVIDRKPETKWHTSGQLPGWKLEVDLGREERIGAVRLDLAYPYDHFPRDLTLKVKSEGGESGFTRLPFREDLATKWELVEALLDDTSRAAVTLRFDPTRVRSLRFWIREGKKWDYSLPDWSMPELHIYRSCRPSDELAPVSPVRGSRTNGSTQDPVHR